MPKRNNPFGDHSVLQLKTHVREKEVDKGVCQQTRMQSVYERTQQLLFSGMRQRQAETERNVALDANDNIMSWSDGNIHAENSAMKQLHLDKNCQLVGSEENITTDMETEASDYPSSLPQIQSTFNFASSKTAVAETLNNCQGCLSPPGASGFGRSSFEYSPPHVLSGPRQRLLSDAETPLHMASNAFLQLKQAQLKKAGFDKLPLSIQACHSCRKPVQSKDVMKCQFCENYVCCTCTRQCGGCHLHFCQLCSVMNYDHSTERAFCLNCQGR